MVAQKRHHLSDVQVQMAHELGFKPDSLRKIDNHKQEPWKTLLPQHIENLYEKRFKREKPEIVKSLKQQLQDDATKREAKKKAKKRGEKPRRNLMTKLSTLNDIVEDKFKFCCFQTRIKRTYSLFRCICGTIPFIYKSRILLNHNIMNPISFCF